MQVKKVQECHIRTLNTTSENHGTSTICTNHTLQHYEHEHILECTLQKLPMLMSTKYIHSYNFVFSRCYFIGKITTTFTFSFC